MIHELIGTKNNTIDLTARDDVADELRQLTLSASTDEFYRHNMYANFGEIGQTIQKLVQNFQEKVINEKCLWKPGCAIRDIPTFFLISKLVMAL